MAETDESEHVSIEMRNLNRRLASQIKGKLPLESPSLLGSRIFRVPRKLRRRGENFFDPNIVSIGPYHRGTEKLAPMENIKMRYLRDLLDRYLRDHLEQFQRPIPTEEPLVCFVESIRGLQKDARNYYSDPFDLDDDKFIEMMVVDGCFLIELFRKDAFIVSQIDDPIFNTSWMLENLYHDLILLENQIPWFVLECLFKLTISADEQESPISADEQEPSTSADEQKRHFLVQLVLRFFETMMLMTEPAEYSPNGNEINHILDLLHGCLLSSSANIIPRITKLELFPPVTDLLQAGVRFKKGTPGNILNIKFSNGEFEIPPIKIQGNSESLFRNLIAYEQCDCHCMDQFTSYAVFLDCLINTSKDADLLCDEGIVIHALSTEDISLLFNRLYNDTLVSRFYYAGITHKVNKYYRSQWPRWRATLKRDYFNNPWSVSSFVAAILVLIFTFTQTLFTILSY